MYDYKKFHVWLMVISFSVLHSFGTFSVFRGCDLYDRLNSEYGDVLEDVFSDFCTTNLCVAGSSISSCENLHKSFFRNIMKGIKRRNKRVKQEIVVCDNRIDKIGKKYAGYLREAPVGIEVNQLISVV